MATARAAASTVDERRARGREARHEVPVPSHRGWKAASDRPDPIALLAQQDETREPDLVPVRHGRMMVSPFTFFRGAARIMAADLEKTPRAGLTVQLCGDAHLSNFGAFASPERRLVFDLNDFDETLPGPFEYDVKRMAASFLIAAQNNGFAKRDATAVTLAAVAAYRRAMAEFARMRTLDIWYAHRDEEQIMAAARARASKAKQVKELKRARKNVAKAHTRDSLQALSRLAERVDGQYRIASQPPVVIPLRDLAATHGVTPDEVEATIQEEFEVAYSKLVVVSVVTSSRSSPSSTSRAKWLASEASAPARSSPCCRGATSRTRCSCRSRRPPRPSSRTTCQGAATSTPGSAWSRAS